MLKENLKDGLKGGIVPLILLGILVAYLLLGDTGLDYAYSLDENLHNQVKITWKEDGDPAYATYRNEKYVYVGKSSLITYSRNDELLSWNGFRWFGYITEFHSDRIDDPVFIYTDYSAFFHEEYDYTVDTFVNSETGYCFVFFDELTLLDSVPFTYDRWGAYPRQTTVEFVSEEHPRIRIIGDLFYINSTWYFAHYSTSMIYEPSDEFVRSLTNWPDV